MHKRTAHPRRLRQTNHPRQGSVLVLAAAVLVVIFGMTAFAIDLGYISMTKTQLNSAADSSALAAALELSPNLGVAPSMTSTQVASNGNAAAVTVAALHRNGDRSSTYVNTARDVRYGQVTWSPISNQWVKSCGSTPYNLVEVTVHRDQVAGTSDGKIPLMFGKTFGVNDAALTEVAAAGLLPGVGVRITTGSTATAGILPIALDLQTWTSLMSSMSGSTGGGCHSSGASDSYAFNPSTGAITTGCDGIPEVDLYPSGSTSMPPGNRGTVDLGSPSNSTADIKRQILYGLNATDLSYFPNNTITTANGPIQLNGDTGISAGIKAELETIKGQPRLIPIFTAVSGPGNNAMYTIVKFVPIRVMNVKLTGNPKAVTVQPAPFSDPSVISGHVSLTSESFFTSPRLVE